MSVRQKFNRFRQSIRFLKSHPLTQKHLIKAIYRYSAFHFVQFIHFNSPCVYPYIGNLKYYASIGEAGITANYYAGLEDFAEMSFLLHFLREGDLFVDVGANVGSYSLLASGMCLAKSIAIEPVPQTFQKLIANCKLNKLEGLIEFDQVALGNKEMDLYFSNLNTSVMNHVISKNDKQINPSRVIQVKQLTLDDLLNIRCPSLIKIDVEGFEFEVLEGASKQLQNSTLKSIIIELNGYGKRYGHSDDLVIRILREAGFSSYWYDPYHRKLKELDSKNDAGFNTIFIRDYEFVAERIASAKKFKVLDEIF